MKISTIIRILSLILLIVTGIVYFTSANEVYFRISILLLLFVSISYPVFKKREEKHG